MKRLRLFRIPLTLALSISLIAGTLLTIGCDGDKPVTRAAVLAVAKEAVAAARDVVPILTANGIDTSKFVAGVGIGDKVVAALERNDTENALLLTADFLTAFDQAALDFALIKDPRKQTLVLAGAAIARGVLRRLADYVDRASGMAANYRVSIPGVTAFSSPQAQSKAEEAKAKIKAFKKKKQSRCKSSVTGKFVRTVMCTTDPDRHYMVTFTK